MDGVTQRQRIRVTGTVQGVGFRPFVYRIARELGITGFVGNDSLGVFIDAQGSARALAALKSALLSDAPPMAQVLAVSVEGELPVLEQTGFRIVASRDDEDGGATSLPPDTAMCENCRREVFDPTNRRYRHPFATCTDCGPRFTITTALPYDRPNTTMSVFPMCAACATEYHDPTDRRFHAQPIACPDCGPTLELVRVGAVPRRAVGEEALAVAIAALQGGETVAIKGVGGFHLACTVEDAAAIRRLRERKRRGDKPFAVLVRDLAEARNLAVVTEEEEALLVSPQSPIVLLRPADNDRARAVAAVVAPGNGRIGIMLPPTPLHALLLAPHPQVAVEPLAAVVLTSCNFTDEPICIDNQEAVANFADVVDAFLMHDRAIHLPCDDSVVRITEAADGALPQPVRRSRGYAPSPVLLPRSVPPTLAVGGELKTAICVAAGERAWMSQHIGDTGDYATMQVLDRVADIMLQVQRVRPERVVADRHPGYLSRRWAIETADRWGVEFVDVQHHHAHFASLLAEHGVPVDEPVLGVAFDGTGYGDDGSIWGGEFLLGTYAAVERVASLKPIALPGGDAAVRRPARISLAHLYAAGVLWDPALPPVAACAGTELTVIRRMLETGASCVDTTSAGRLFDAVSSLTGVTQSAGYEGQAAIELEALAADSAAGVAWILPDALEQASDGRLLLDPTALIAATARDVLSGQPAGIIGARFHQAMAEAVLTIAERIRLARGVATVGLTGGVFQNALLTSLCSERLSAAGFRVLVHRLVPANDGGLALGQVLAGSP